MREDCTIKLLFVFSIQSLTAGCVKQFLSIPSSLNDYSQWHGSQGQQSNAALRKRRKGKLSIVLLLVYPQTFLLPALLDSPRPHGLVPPRLLHIDPVRVATPILASFVVIVSVLWFILKEEIGHQFGWPWSHVCLSHSCFCHEQNGLLRLLLLQQQQSGESLGRESTQNAWESPSSLLSLSVSFARPTRQGRRCRRQRRRRWS